MVWFASRIAIHLDGVWLQRLFYAINKKTRLNMEIADRSAEAVDFGTGAGPNDNLDGVDTRYAIQLTHIF